MNPLICGADHASKYGFDGYSKADHWCAQACPQVPGCGRAPAGPALSNLALNRPTQTSSQSQWSHPDDGHGAVDGVINGQFGFHTNNDPNPWWQVDLGGEAGITEIIVYNRLDCCAERSRTMSALISDDGQNWTPIFQNPGTVFGGQDGNPLHIPVNGNARFVRLQLNEQNFFHLDEVQVIGGAPFAAAPPASAPQPQAYAPLPQDYAPPPQAPDSSWLAGLWVDLNGSGITITPNGPTFSMSYDNGRGPFTGQVLDGANISGVFDGQTITGVVDSSNVIHWSNNTSWTLSARANPAVSFAEASVTYDAPPPTYVAPPPPEVYVAPPPPPSPVGYWGQHPVPGGGWCPFGGPHLHNYEPEFIDQFVLEDGYLRWGYGFSTWPFYGPHPIPGGGWCAIDGVHTHGYRPEGTYRYDRIHHSYLYDNVHVTVIREGGHPQRPPPTYRPPEVVVHHVEAHPPPVSVGFKRPPPIIPVAVPRPAPGRPGVAPAPLRPSVAPATFHPGIAPAPNHPEASPAPFHPGVVPAPYHPNTPAPAPYHPTAPAPAPAPFHPSAPSPAPYHPAAPTPAPAPFHPSVQEPAHPAPVHAPAPAPVHPAQVHPAVAPPPAPKPPEPPPPPKPAPKPAPKKK
jgi:hypothetical protein